MSHKEFEDHLKQRLGNIKIKSMKISRDEFYKSKGYGFVCFDSAEET